MKPKKRPTGLYQVKTNTGGTFYFKKANFRTKVGSRWGGEAGAMGVKTKSVKRIKKPTFIQKLKSW